MEPVITDVRVAGEFGVTLAFNYRDKVWFASREHHAKLKPYDVVIVIGLGNLATEYFPPVTIDHGHGTITLDQAVKSAQLSAYIDRLEQEMEAETYKEGTVYGNITDWPAVQPA